jgi:hypothetical protein
MSENRALVPADERAVDFYGDELRVFILDGEPYIPLRPICDYLGVSWSGQNERIRRDAVLSEAIRYVRVTRTNRGGRPELLCLPLEYLNGWLFGINASRVREELKERLIRYQKECYRVLAQAFQGTTVSTSSSALAQIRDMALAIANMAEQQIILEGRVATTEARLDKAAVVVGDLGKRLGRLESRLSPGATITDEQAAEVSQRVKALAGLLQERTPGKNCYQSIFGELYRRFNVSGYKLIRQSQYAEVLAFLDEWGQGE